MPNTLYDAHQGFIKFWGNSQRRWDSSVSIQDDVCDALSHLECAYPKRPKIVEEGAVIFMGRMAVEGIIITGRAIAIKHHPLTDVATDKDIQRRPWKEKYCYRIRVQHPEFLLGTIKEGIPLDHLIKELGADCFETTYQRSKAGELNINPKESYRRQPSVRLSQMGIKWMNEQFEHKLAKMGRIPESVLATFADRPSLPRTGGIR